MVTAETPRVGRKMDSGNMSQYLSILDTYKRLSDRLEDDSDSLHVETIDGYEWARLGVTSNAVLLLLPPEAHNRGPNQDLEHIWISPKKNYKIENGPKTRIESVAVIATKSREGWLVKTFLELIAMLFDTGVNSEPESVKKLITDLVSLFRALTQPSRKSTQGLWGELFLIDQSTDVNLAVGSWHTTPNDRYDFAHSHERVEVKTTTGPRIHMFSHAQLIPVEGLRVTIASLVLSISDVGATCADLVLQILPKLKSESARRLFVDQVVRTLGDSWNNTGSLKYDLDHAKQGLRYFNVLDVPKILETVPPNVHGLKYQSDLQAAAETTRSDIESRDSLTLAFFEGR
jgi:hypothetical protein